jgi:anti-sigma factor RsiW
MTEPSKPAIQRDHAVHDPTWMAALASRDPDLSTADRTSAEAALASCGACADLFAELVAVSTAIPSAAIPARPRDFTLTAADAARLRRRGVRGWLAGLGSVRDGISFPLAMSLTTMGIAALLFATVPAALSGMGGATAGAAPEALSTVGAAVPQPAPATEDVRAAVSAAPSTVAAAAAPAASAAPTAEADRYLLSPVEPDMTGDVGVFSGDDGDGANGTGQRQDANEMAHDASIRDDATGQSVLLVLGATLLIVGLGLFALRWTARRS